MATMTAAQRREEAKAEFTAFMENCPAHQLLAIMSNKWSTMILNELAGGTLRYADISRALPGVSPKMITQTVRGLERDGFVGRTVTPSVPVQVEYTLTLLGERAIPLLNAVKAFADSNIGEIEAARRRYDTESARTS